MRFDTGSVPVGISFYRATPAASPRSRTWRCSVCDQCFKSTWCVCSATFGGSARSIVITVDPKKLQSYSMSPDEVIVSLTKGNTLSPSGNIPIGDTYPIVPVNSVVKDPQQLGAIPIRVGDNPVFLRDVGIIQDSADAPAGYALVNGRRAVTFSPPSEPKHQPCVLSITSRMRCPDERSSGR